MTALAHQEEPASGAPAEEVAVPSEPTWAGPSEGAFAEAVRLHDRGRLEEAERWYRRAAEAGHAEAANSLALLLDERGATEAAEPWYRLGAENGSVDAACNLNVAPSSSGSALTANAGGFLRVSATKCGAP